MARLALQNVSMRYPRVQRGIIHGVTSVIRGRPEESKYALKNIDIDLQHGQRLGLLGLNGAGKTTLLMVMAGIYPPSEGRVIREGRTETLFGLGAGVDEDLTGAENIALYLRERGLSGAERKRVGEACRELSELDTDRLNEPVRAYSAGMRARLVFSLALALDPEILLIDEYFGAGDPKFRMKARDVLNDTLDSSGVVVFASQNIKLLTEMCTHGLVMDRGEAVFLGEIGEAVSVYNKINVPDGYEDEDLLSLEDLGPKPPPPLTVSLRSPGIGLSAADAPEGPESVALITLTGGGDAALNAMARSLAGCAGLTIIDVAERRAAQGISANARIARLNKPAPARGALIAGLDEWPGFPLWASGQGKTAIIVRDPVTLARELWLKSQGWPHPEAEAFEKGLDDKAIARFAFFAGEARVRLEAALDGVSDIQELAEIYRFEAVADDPASAARSLARHWEIEVDEADIAQAVEAFRAAEQAPYDRPVLSRKDQALARRILNPLARELGYSENRAPE